MLNGNAGAEVGGHSTFNTEHSTFNICFYYRDISSANGSGAIIGIPSIA
jgi:hypothetical protein